MWKLVDARNGKEILVGTLRPTSRNEVVKVVGLHPPHKPGSTGKVSVELRSGSGMLYYPVVIGAKFVSKGDWDEKPAAVVSPLRMNLAKLFQLSMQMEDLMSDRHEWDKDNITDDIYNDVTQLTFDIMTMQRLVALV